MMCWISACTVFNSCELLSVSAFTRRANIPIRALYFVNLGAPLAAVHTLSNRLSILVLRWILSVRRIPEQMVIPTQMSLSILALLRIPTQTKIQT